MKHICRSEASVHYGHFLRFSCDNDDYARQWAAKNHSPHRYYDDLRDRRSRSEEDKNITWLRSWLSLPSFFAPEFQQQRNEARGC